MKLVENHGHWLAFVLFISKLSVRLLRFRELYGAGYLMTGFCSAVLREKIYFSRIYSLKIRFNNIPHLFICFVVRLTYLLHGAESFLRS
jgi:hypothetical protein